MLTALKFLQHPKATGVIFRRNSAMIKAPGSVWQEAVAMFSEIYPKNLRIRHRELEIILPHGAVLKFSHLQHESNIYDWKGSQLSFVAFDAGSEFTEEMITYLM